MGRLVLLVRHGVIDWSGRIGALEDGLSEEGRWQARALARRLRRFAPAALYSSPLRRARETAWLLAEELGLSVHLDERLAEWDAGQWTGLTEDEVRERYPQEWRRSRADPSYRPPGAETAEALQERVASALTAAREAHPQGDLVLVGHAAALSALICHVLGLTFGPREQRLFALETCSLTVVEEPDNLPHLVLVALNDTCHLRGQP